MRIKRGLASHRKHKRLFESVKGYKMSRHRLVKVAKESLLHAGKYAYTGRKDRKSDFRRLWITRISQAVKLQGLKYSEFINKLHKAKIDLDRKLLSSFLVSDPAVFQAIIDKVKKS